MSKMKLATVWLDGCSGCHMSLLDMDERLLELTAKLDLLYSPLVDTKTFPEWVDITLVEGAVSNDDDLRKIRKVRAHTATLVSLGDCAVTGNVPSMRDLFPVADMLNRVYFETADLTHRIPDQVVPKLLSKVRPVHEFVHVDVFVPGCPPSADAIHFVLSELAEGRMPEIANTARFGA